MAETIGSRVAVLEQLFRTFHEDTREYRNENKQDVKAILEKLHALQQAVGSTANAVHTLTLQDCGARLLSAEQRLKVLEDKTACVPEIEKNVDFYRRVFGAGWAAFWRLLGLIISSGLLGAVIAEIWQ